MPKRAIRLGLLASAAIVSVLQIAAAPAQPAYTENAAGFPTSVTGQGGATARFAYDAAGRIVEMVDPLGRRVRIAYQGNTERPVEITGPGEGGPVKRITYDAIGRPVRIEVNGVVAAEFSFDPQGHLLEKRIRGRVWRSTYDANGHLASETDAIGRVWRYAYDAQGRLVQATNPAGGIERVVYDNSGKVAALIDAMGARIDPESVYLPQALTESSSDEPSYDAVGRVIANNNPASGRTTFQYDDQSRMVGMRLPSGVSVRWDYDALGRPIRAVDQRGRAIAYGYDDTDNLTQVTSASGERAAYRYDAVGRLTGVTRPNGSNLGLTYDVFDNLTQTRLAGGGTRSATYDRAGRPLTSQDASGRTITYSYNAQGRTAARAEPGGRTSRFAYDTGGRITAVDDPAWPVNFVYRADGTLTETRFPAAGAVLAIASNQTGLRQSLTTPAGRLAYEYDARRMLAALTTPAGRIAFTYDAAGRLSAAVLPNGIRGAWRYAASGALAGLRWAGRDGAVLADWTVTRDPSGMPATVTNGMARRNFFYDNEGRLTGETNAQGTSQFGYAPGGDISRILRDGQMLQLRYDAAGRLVDAGGAVAYDRDDRITALPRANGNARFDWDADDRLVGAAAGANIRFVYDAFGHLVRREAGTDVKQYLYDDEQPVVVLGGDRKVVAFNIFAPGCSAPILTIAGDEALFLPCDPFGGTALVTDARGTVVGRVETDAFGYAAALPAKPAGLFLLHGMEYDRELALYHAGLRWYDPRLGRFLTPDSLVGKLTDVQSQSAYSFARNAPTAFADPTGAGAVDLDLMGSLSPRAQFAINSGKLNPSEFLILQESLAKNMQRTNIQHASWLPRSLDVLRGHAGRILEDMILESNKTGNKLWKNLNELKMFKSLPLEPSTMPAASPSGVAAASESSVGFSSSYGAGTSLTVDAPASTVSARPLTPQGPAGASVSGRGSILSINTYDEFTTTSGRAQPVTQTGPQPVTQTAPQTTTQAAPRAATNAGRAAAAAETAAPAASTNTSSNAAATEPTAPGWADIAKAVGIAAVINGITDAANCGAKTGDITQCAGAFGQGTLNGLVIGSIAAGVVVGATKIGAGALAWGTTAGYISAATAATTATLTTLAAGAVMVAGTAYMGGRLGRSLGEFHRTLVDGTPQERARAQNVSSNTLVGVDLQIAELTDIGKLTDISEQLNEARRLREVLRGVRGNRPAAPGSRNAPDPVQDIGAACTAASGSLFNLTGMMDDANAAVDRAAELLRAQDRLDLSPNATRTAVNAGNQAYGKLSSAALVVRLIATQLRDIGSRSRSGPSAAAPATASNDNADATRQQIAAYTGAVDRLKTAASGVQTLRTRFDQTKDRLVAEARAAQPRVTEGDRQALDRRIALLLSANFAAQRQLEDANEIVRTAPGEIAATNRLVDTAPATNAAGNPASQNPAAACAEFLGQPPGWLTKANQLRTGAFRELQLGKTKLDQADVDRRVRLNKTVADNNQLIAAGGTKLAQAKAANDANAQRQIQAIIDAAQLRIPQTLTPQATAIDTLARDSGRLSATMDEVATSLAAVR